MSADLTGAIQGQRLGSFSTVHTLPYSWNTTGINAGILVGVIRASANKPVQIEVSYVVATAFDGAGSSVGVGTTTTATEWINATSTQAAGYFPAANAVGKFRLVADTPIYIRQYGDADEAAGAAVVIVKEQRQASVPVTLPASGVPFNLSTANISGTTVTLVFSSAVTGQTGFSAVVGGVAATMTYVSGSGSATLLFTSSVAAVALDVVTLAYTPGNIVSGDYPLSIIASMSVTNDTV